jgi:hypothetical protein
MGKLHRELYLATRKFNPRGGGGARLDQEQARDTIWSISGKNYTPKANNSLKQKELCHLR